MGIHLKPLIIKGVEEVTIYGDYDWITESYSFDKIRYAGDKEFIYTEELEWIYKKDERVEESCIIKRPKSILLAMSWVEENINPGTQIRLMKLLEDMKENKQLWIKIIN